MKILDQKKKKSSKKFGERLRRAEYRLATLLLSILGVIVVLCFRRRTPLFLGDASCSIYG